jgi:sec-independent protein translocase protein TatA
MGVKEILIIALIIIILFGAKKIPQLMRGLGTGIREFKSAKDQDPSEGIKEPVQ